MSVEELEDVLAEMDSECGDMYDGTITLNDERYRSYIQRIRDAVEMPPEILAMRNALKHCIEELSPYCNGGARRDEVLEEAKAALDFPARNCDLARDWLHDLYVHFKPPASVRREMPPEWVDAIMAFCRWLVKPVKEGGAK